LTSIESSFEACPGSKDRQRTTPKIARTKLNDLVVPHPLSTYFMQVEGDSMMNACIFHEDVIVVDRAITATHNKIVVAKLGEEFTLKRLQIMKGGKRIFLKSENPNYSLLEVTGRQDFELWVVVTWVVHRLAGPRPKRT